MVLENTMVGLRYLMKTKSDFIKMSNLNLGSSNTMGFRVMMVDNMYLWAVGRSQITMYWPLEGCLRFKKPFPPKYNLYSY